MLDGVTREMLIALDETFGPVVPVIEISSDREALEMTNGSPFGLTAAVFTEDLERGLAFAEASAGRLGEHQRLDQPVGISPPFRRSLGQRQRPGPGRGPLAVRGFHRAEDDPLPRATAISRNSPQRRQHCFT